MKRLLSLVLALAVLCALAVTAYAANIDVGVSAGSISAGDTLTVTVALEETIPVSADAYMMQGELHYDGDVLEFVSVEKGADYQSPYFNAGKHAKENKVLFNYLDFSISRGPVEFKAGTIVTVTFQAKAEIAADHVNTVLEFKNAYVQNAQGENVGDLTYKSSVSVLVCREHTWDDGVVTTEPTCTTKGVKTYTCTFDGCGAAYTEEIEALGHSYTDGVCTHCDAKDPDYSVTVLASGWSGYTTWELTSDGVLAFSPTEQTLASQCNMRNYWKVSGVLTLPWGEYADMITSVVIEEGIHDLGQMAFYGMPNLESVTLAESVTEIRNYTFKNCKALTSINLENVDYIREGAFYGCEALTDVTLSEGVVVEDWAFSKTGAIID